jgi:hypothetical protein
MTATFVNGVGHPQSASAARSSNCRAAATGDDINYSPLNRFHDEDEVFSNLEDLYKGAKPGTKA